MVSGRLPKDSVANVEINMFWDGIFHSSTWAATLLGVWMLWQAARVPNVVWSGRVFGGALFLGWGLFNLVEGILNHHVLHLHHVVEQRGESIYDLLFLLSGVIFIVCGVVAIRSATRTIGPIPERPPEQRAPSAAARPRRR
jgi:uncharacterized membrane protein